MHRGRFAITLFFPILLLWLGNFVKAAEFPAIEKGVLDLSKSNTDPNAILTLSGDWEFFFQRFTDQIPGNETGQFIQVPGNWDEISQFNSNYSEGFGTYRLQLKGLNPDRIYGLKIPTIHSASQIWIDGKMLASFGDLGREKSEETPQIAGQLLFFSPDKSEAEIFIEVSNFHFFQSGIWSPIYFGEEHAVISFDRQSRMFSFLLVGGLMIMGVYHLFLAYIQRSFLESLFFGLACIFLAIRELAGPDAILMDLFPYLSHGVLVRTVYLCLGLAFTFQTLFLFRLFLPFKNQWIYKVQYIIMGIFILAILFLNTRDGAIFFNYFTLFLAPPFILFTLYIVVRAAIKKTEGAWVFLVGLLFFYGAASHDYLINYQSEGVNMSYWMPYGFFFFILSESVVLSIRFNRAFLNEAKLSTQLGQTNESLKRFIPREFLKLLGKNEIVDVQLGDAVSKDMTVLFADVRNFTSLSEGLSSKETFEFVNRLLTRTDPIIRKNQGFIDKYIGDAVMALFANKPDDAIQAALELQREVQNNNLLSNQKIGIGVGIHYGNLILGTVGSKYRMDGTVISDAVNTASRIEELTKVYKLDILISEDLKNQVVHPEKFHFRLIDTLNLRGKRSQNCIYEVYDDPEKYPPGFLDHYEKGMQFFRNVDIKEAKVHLDKALNLKPDDGPCQYFLEKLAEYSRVQQNLE
ncbi:adenylate/guanylate cyclase domain-containing protein [Algoriphagus limi]|uniref:Adenylate/guanylate cyclase domain-containing protein n=1 Tax=Algoriphagus limi TaxID=2975273 RepID=A0ABT2G8S1_9BACT|nr:adenylate/guanylate cyclase domain-containing protein [Algoriphagus limi]MCS5490342.1 adenylate/guanylate cyclase domain-containing protein [Algoriphagus limi]